MEQRKLIQHGISSLTVALPIKWIKEHGLSKGDAIKVDIEGNKVICSTEESLRIEKVSIDVTKLDRTSILLAIQSLYRFGYNEIEAMFDNPTTTHHRSGEKVSISSILHQIVGRCIGAEIIEQSEKRILIKTVTREAEEDFTVILRRIFLLLCETAESLLDGIRKNDKMLISTIEEKHDNINKFVSYALRLLNKYGYPDVRKTCFYYHIIASIDKIVDILKYNARDIIKNDKKFKPETMDIWEQVNRSIRGYYDLFYNFDFEKVNKLSCDRDHIKQLMKSRIKNIPVDEIVYLTNMKQILEIILDLTDFRIGLEYPVQKNKS